MVLGALLVVTAVSYYAKRKGIPVEEVWNSCSCGGGSSAATQAMVDDSTEDYDLSLRCESQISTSSKGGAHGRTS
jgi:hypothetical protein